MNLFMARLGTLFCFVGAPSPRIAHKAVWTGTEMIVWAGYDGTARVNDGKCYHPQYNTWGAAISTVGAPPPVSGRSAVWDGSNMIVWGGDHNDVEITNLGGRYNPVADSWQPTTTTNALSARRSNEAILGGWLHDRVGRLQPSRRIYELGPALRPSH